MEKLSGTKPTPLNEARRGLMRDRSRRPDRLLHHSHILNTPGEGCRLRGMSSSSQHLDAPCAKTHSWWSQPDRV